MGHYHIRITQRFSKREKMKNQFILPFLLLGFIFAVLQCDARSFKNKHDLTQKGWEALRQRIMTRQEMPAEETTVPPRIREGVWVLIEERHTPLKSDQAS